MLAMILSRSFILTPTAHSRIGDDVYDPFADYSEFGGQEEADINFFRHGRFVTIGSSLCYRIFTEALNCHYRRPAATRAAEVGIVLGGIFFGRQS